MTDFNHSDLELGQIAVKVINLDLHREQDWQERAEEMADTMHAGMWAMREAVNEGDTAKAAGLAALCKTSIDRAALNLMTDIVNPEEALKFAVDSSEFLLELRQALKDARDG